MVKKNTIRTSFMLEGGTATILLKYKDEQKIWNINDISLNI